MTNNHVLPNQQTAADAYVEFNFETDPTGNSRTRYKYTLDPTSFITNKDLDFTRVKINQASNPTPLNNWGYLDLAPDATPVMSDPVNIIQHPNGDDKQIALTSNEVISIWGSKIFYKADTEPGSSGSPVFNQDWKVVALHHAGKLMSEGGLTINDKGEKASANRGILISFILDEIKKYT
jgi:endonuclease G